MNPLSAPTAASGKDKPEKIHPRRSRLPSILQQPSRRQRRRRNKAAKLALEQFGEAQRGAIFQIRTNDLHADRQTRLGAADGYGGGGQARQGGHPGPSQLVEVGIKFT